MLSEADNQTNQQKQDVLVQLSSLASLTGFPISVIKKELFGEEVQADSIRLSRLRELMLKYLDQNHF